jgi:hypothetical protein
MKSLLLILSLSLLLNACSSAKKQASALSDQGLHEQAVVHWQRALENNPKDKEAIAGLVRSQDMAINARLIQIRGFRTSNEPGRALRAYKELVDLQERWNYKMDINSASFQGKEAASLWHPLKQEFSLHLEQGRPLAAASTFEDFKNLFSFISPEEMNTEWQRILKAGQATCAGFKNRQQHPFLSSFQLQYCRYFRVKTKDNVFYDQLLYSKILPNINVDGLDQNLTLLLSGNLESNFQQTPWFLKSSGRQIPLELTGSYQTHVRSVPVKQAHNYVVKEAYVVHENVKKERRVPVHGASGITYRNEEYTESVPVTKHRNVNRVYEYQADKKSQELVIKISGKFLLDGQTYDFQYTKQDTNSVIIHDLNIPHIGLSPSKKDLTPVIEQFKRYSEEAAQSFKERVTGIWLTSYCTLPGDRDPSAIGEHALRCRKARSAQYQNFVANWFQQNHGITAEVVEKTLGDF